MASRSERMKARWSDPSQAARMRAGLAKGHRTIADRLEAAITGEPGGDPPAGGPPEDRPPGGGSGTPPPDPSPGRGAGGILSASPRDLIDRIFGGSTK
jgi:hypothetical protein